MSVIGFSSLVIILKCLIFFRTAFVIGVVLQVRKERSLRAKRLKAEGGIQEARRTKKNARC